MYIWAATLTNMTGKENVIVYLVFPASVRFPDLVGVLLSHERAET